MGRKGLVQVNWNCLPSQATLGAKEAMQIQDPHNSKRVWCMERE